MSTWALIALGVVVWVGVSVLIILFFHAANHKDPPRRPR